MPKSPKQKQKLLYIAKLLTEQTDETHTVNAQRIIDYLASCGIKAERKSIYDDIETLRDFGYDILHEEGRYGGYFLASRDFELAEVKLLVDLVQSSKFITTKKSRELIKKLAQLISKNDAAALRRQVVVTDRNKTANEHIYYSVDVIYEAIAHNEKVRFRYFSWDAKGQRMLRKDGAYYEVSPWLLTWDDENYYLIAFDDTAGIMKHYRVDKMTDIERSRDVRTGKAVFEKMDIAAFSKKTFGMFAGEERTVRLLADNDMTGVLIDRFGAGVAIRPYDDDQVILRADVQVSPQFFGWLAGLGSRVKIESPEDVAGEYASYLRIILSRYGSVRDPNRSDSQIH